MILNRCLEDLIMSTENQEITNSDSFPEILCDWKFVTKQSQEVYSRVFKTLSQAHVHIGIISRVTQNINKGVREDKSEQAEQTLAELYDKLETSMDEEKERLVKLLEDNAINAKASYSSPKELTVSVKSPQDTKYLSILAKLDVVVTLLDTLWLFGVLDNKQKIVAVMNWKRHVVKTANRIIDLSTKMRAAATKSSQATKPEVEKEQPKASVAVIKANAQEKKKSSPVIAAKSASEAKFAVAS